MDTIRFRDALRVRESLDPNAFYFISYRIKTARKSESSDIAVAVASSLVSGVSGQLPWDSDFGRHLAVVDLNEIGSVVTFEVAIPMEVVGAQLDIARILAIASLPAEYGETSNLWIDDIQFPRAVLPSVPNLRPGGTELYRRLGGKGTRPLVSVILKPRYGGDLAHMASHAFKVLKCGVDGIVDDELLFDPVSSFAFEDRVRVCSATAALAERATGSSKYFIPNIVCKMSQVDDYLAIVGQHPIKAVMSNSFAMGYPAFEYLAQKAHNADLAVIDCSIGATIMSLPTARAGIAMELLTKLSRFAGADGAHTGSVGEHWYTATLLRRVLTSLKGAVPGVPPALPVVAGNVNLSNVWHKARPFGDESVVNAGSGIWFHPSGPEYGAEHLLRSLTRVPLDAEPSAADEHLAKLCSRDARFAKAVDHFNAGA